MKRKRHQQRRKKIATDTGNLMGKLHTQHLKDAMKDLEAKATDYARANTVSMLDRRKAQRRERSTILQEAEYLIYGEKNKTYRHPNENFKNIKNLWNSYFIAINQRNAISHNTTDIQEIDVAAMMVLMKIARIATNINHLESWVDVAGYAGCAERIIKNK